MRTLPLRYKVFFLASFMPAIVFAYDLDTHGVVTNQAYSLSKLGRSEATLNQLGLYDLAAPFDTSYYDFTGIDVRKRFATTFESSRMRDPQRDQLRIRGWLMRGAIREDDLSNVGAQLAGEGQPYFLDPDPSGNIDRVCNHFFDPITRNALSSTLLGSPLTYQRCPNGTNISSPNWALGTTVGGSDAFSTSPLDAVSRNHFSVFSAREAMWRALTLKSKDGNSATVRVFGDTDEQARKAYWAATFRALGDVLHLNQDSAQPQHTRNEAHGLGHAAVYEKYVDARAAGATEFVFDSEGKVTAATGQLPALSLNNIYPIPQFNRYSDYWSTDRDSASITAGRGLADYSSRGFFTPGKNLGNTYSGFPSPTNDEAVYRITTDTPQFPGDCTGYAGRVTYAKGDMPADFIAGATGTTRYASRSLLATQWTLNRCVFDDRIDLLIPRAVAYSAGLIDYFFRGQLTVKPTPQGVFAVIDQLPPLSGSNGFTKIKAQLHNSTPDIATPGGPAVQAMTSGILVAVAKFYRDTCFSPGTGGVHLLPPPGAPVCRSANEEILVSTPLRVPADTAIPSGAAPAVTVTLNFDPANPIPVNATDLSLQFVYRGVLGTETDAVVVQTVNVSEPTLITTSNDFDYAWDANNIRYQVPVQDQQTLPAVYFVFASDTAPQSPLSGFSIAAPVAPGKYGGVWTLVDIAAPPSYGSAICAQCPYDLFNVIPRRVETATDGSGTKLVSIPPYQQRGTWQNNGTTFAPAMPPTVCPIGTSLADCLTRNLPAYNPLTPSARVTVDF